MGKGFVYNQSFAIKKEETLVVNSSTKVKSAVHRCRGAFLSGFYPELVEGFFCTRKRKNIMKEEKLVVIVG